MAYTLYPIYSVEGKQRLIEPEDMDYWLNIYIFIYLEINKTFSWDGFVGTMLKDKVSFK